MVGFQPAGSRVVLVVLVVLVVVRDGEDIAGEERADRKVLKDKRRVGVSEIC